MALSSTQKSVILARIKRKEELLEKAEATLEEILANPVEDYRLDTAEGTQRARRRDPEKLKKIIDSLESEIVSLWAKLRNAGLTSVRLRRKRGYPIDYRTL